ncbi:hypothetical protein SKAU_G00332530 [Synaphobranchus kaupii]|uniref:Uncharacterized protein n=1 Tax=Synaphobranchus kaupii TaxID=118154 RepID=A0A9Q1ELD8_SYNKA|nr:hypothetical protein SKAU_G00332530 [Synaphobranchus kaupii]
MEVQRFACEPVRAVKITKAQSPPMHSFAQAGEERERERGVEIWLSSERNGFGENKSAFSVHGEFSQATTQWFLNPAVSERAQCAARPAWPPSSRDGRATL